MGHKEISIVRLNDAAIVDGAILAAVGLLLEYHL
jgi:dihydroxyacetone kinase DhaKLM complex PTS-EIIA-like component DhaM